MKVGTDSVILGALVTLARPRQILDVGTGTGVVALMLAQRTEKYGSQIRGLEIDFDAFHQASQNIASSPWTDRLTIEHDSIRNFAEHYEGPLHDVIVCNPPYFQGSRPANVARHQSRHTDSLPPEQLLKSVSAILTPEGTFAVIMPCEVGVGFLELARQFGLRVSRRVDIVPLPGKPAKRTLLELRRELTPEPQAEILVIEHWHHN